LLFRNFRREPETYYLLIAAADSLAEPDKRLEAMISAHVEASLQDRDIHMTMLVELRALPRERRDEVVRRRNRHESLLRGAVEEGRAAGRIRSDIEAKYLTLTPLDLLNWTIFRFDRAGGKAAVELGDILASVFLKGARRADAAGQLR
jgi:Tetracyclin repressor-like, C-terminal domain